MKQTIYLVPFSESGLQDKFFSPYPNPKANVPPFGYLKTYLNQHNLEIRTIDFWSPPPAGGRRADDMIIVFNHPPIGFYKFLYFFRDLVYGKNSFPLKNRRLLQLLSQFPKKILVQWESPVNNPWVYKNIQSITSHYDKLYFIPKADGWPRFYYPQNFDRLNEEYFDNLSRKFLVMMNSQSRAKGFWKNELYSERVRALEFFSQHNEVDLYGSRWENESASFIKKIWRGFADDKPATMGQYTFALCFENAVWPDYITEKIFDCMQVGTIPVYWGAPDIEKDVPLDCFIDMRKFKNYGALRAFLHALTFDQIKRHKEAMRSYFASENFKRFTPEYFAKTILAVITNNVND